LLKTAQVPRTSREGRGKRPGYPLRKIWVDAKIKGKRQAKKTNLQDLAPSEKNTNIKSTKREEHNMEPSKAGLKHH